MAAHGAVATAVAVESSKALYAEVIPDNFGSRGGGAIDSIGVRVRPSREQLQSLSTMGLTPGLVDCIAAASENCARRYWIVDNSGSMSISDGVKILGGQKVVQCTRWEELGETLKWHGAAAAKLQAHTEFRVLNMCRGITTPCCVVGGVGVDNNAALAELNSIISSSPSSGTPLCQAIADVSFRSSPCLSIKIIKSYTTSCLIIFKFFGITYLSVFFFEKVVASIRLIADELRSVGRTVSVIIATDGEVNFQLHFFCAVVLFVVLVYIHSPTSLLLFLEL